MTLQCRTCGNVIYYKNAMNLFELKNRETLTDIQMIVGKALEKDPELPSHICGCCLLDLRQTLMHIKLFRERCIKTQEQLQDSRMLIAEEEVKFEYDEDFQESDCDVDDLADELIGFEEEENAQDMPSSDDSDVDADSLITSVQNKMNRSDSRESEEEFEKISVNDNDIDSNQSSSSNLIDDDIKSEDTNKTKPGKEKIYNVLESDQGKSHKIKVKKKRYSSWKDLTEEQIIERKREQRRRDCICDQCGRHFTDQSNFKLHMLRHSGVKNFQCKQCSKRFYTEHLTQLHERTVHLGERPYACKYCDKTFQNSTTRIVHERCHTNVRPYICKFCEKAFSYASGLSRHLLIHNGVRKYFCTVCDRDFQRNTHLKAHLRSKQHALKQANKNLLRESE